MVDVAHRHSVDGFTPLVGKHHFHGFLRSDVHLYLGPIHGQIMVLAGHEQGFLHLMRLPTHVSDYGIHMKHPFRVFLIRFQCLRGYSHDESALLVGMYGIRIDGAHVISSQPSFHGITHLGSRHRCPGERCGTAFEHQRILILGRPTEGL